MFTFDKKLPIQVQITRPDAKYYFLLDHQLEGCREGLKQASVYIRQSFMIHNEKFHEVFMQLGASKITDMEVLAQMIHQMHGEDDRYYDESNDDTPVFEYIKPCKEQSHANNEASEQKQHHVNNDLSAAVMRNMQFEEKQIHLYEQLIRYIDDDGADIVFEYLKESSNKAFETLRNLLHILTEQAEVKDFGLGESHNAWDLDTSNYFDKPNPIFINPGEVEDMHFPK